MGAHGPCDHEPFVYCLDEVKGEEKKGGERENEVQKRKRVGGE